MSSWHYQGRNGTGCKGGSNSVPFWGGIYPPMPLPPSLGGGKHLASAGHVTKRANESQPEQNSLCKGATARQAVSVELLPLGGLVARESVFAWAWVAAHWVCCRVPYCGSTLLLAVCSIARSQKRLHWRMKFHSLNPYSTIKHTQESRRSPISRKRLVCNI